MKQNKRPRVNRKDLLAFQHIIERSLYDYMNEINHLYADTKREAL